MTVRNSSCRCQILTPTALLAVRWLPSLFGAYSEACDSKSKPLPRNLYSLDKSASPLYSACAHASVLSLLGSVVPCWICTHPPCVICQIISFDRHHYWYTLQLRFLKHRAHLYASILGDVTSVIVILHKTDMVFFQPRLQTQSDLSFMFQFHVPCQLCLQYSTIWTRPFNSCWCTWLLIISWRRIGTVPAGKYPLSLCFSEVDFLGCSSSSAGHVWSDLGEDPAEWRFSEADCCGCSSSTGEKLGHSKLEGGSTLSCINDNEFLVAHYSLGED